jgi:ribosome biogenesis ATPase
VHGLGISGIPDEEARERILSVQSKKLTLRGSFDFKRLARRTSGFVGADLEALSVEAATLALERVFASKQTKTSSSSDIVDELDDQDWREPWTSEDMENLAMTMQDFEVTLQPI